LRPDLVNGTIGKISKNTILITYHSIMSSKDPKGRRKGKGKGSGAVEDYQGPSVHVSKLLHPNYIHFLNMLICGSQTT
jgi:hypothetical protein